MIVPASSDGHGVWQTYNAMKAQPRRTRRNRRKAPDGLPGVTATARLDRRTKSLVNRLCPGDIAIIDHADLDLTGADALIGRNVAAVVNASRSITGRYPNRGPQHLLDAGIYVAPSQFEAMFVSTVHSAADVDRTVEAVADFFSSGR